MAKIQTSDLFTSVSGKLCSSEGTYIALNKRTGKMYSAVRHHFTNANTEEQQIVRNDFASRAKFASKWWNTNKPSAEQPKGSDSYQLVMKAYKGQRKIGNPYSYLRMLVGDDFKVMLGDLDITGTIVMDGSGTTSGGSSASGGASASGSFSSDSSSSSSDGEDGDQAGV